MPTKAETVGHYDVDEHILSPAEVAQKYNVNVDFTDVAKSQGLTPQAVAELQTKHGPNRLTPPKQSPEWLKFLKQFTNPLMLLLLIAGGLLFLAWALQSPRDRNNLILAIALIIVVSATCALSYLQERSANNVMASLKKLLPSQCIVIRGGSEVKVEATELVPGDLVSLKIGDRIPADIRIIETFDLKTEQSSLTGESDLVPATVDKKHDLVAEARNVIFMSTLAMNGQGKGIVIRTGDNTFIGKIATLAGGTGQSQSSLKREVKRLVFFVAAIAFTTGIILFVVGIIRSRSLPNSSNAMLQAFVNGFILVVVANVPEGLPATVTSILALTATRLRDKNVLIKQTDIIEALGAATIIASDKTGTLTQNRMTVENIWCNCELRPASMFQPILAPLAPTLAKTSLTRTSLARQTLNRMSRQVNLAKASLARQSVSDPHTQMTVGRAGIPRGDGTFDFTPQTVSSKKDDSSTQNTLDTFAVQNFDLNTVTWEGSSTLTKLLTMATVCNKANFSFDKGDDKPKDGQVAVPMFMGESSERKILGDATDSGLLRYADRLAPAAITRLAYRKVFEIPFNSANKWAMVISELPGTPGKHLVMMKGAPEIILTKCSQFYHGGQDKPIDDGFLANMNMAYERCGFMGERVIGFAYTIVTARSAESYGNEETPPPTSDLSFMGLISLVDPPRVGVAEAVNKCRSAGIRVAMVTGDHPLTAEAIARKVGIITLATPREVAAESHVPESEIAVSDERVGAVVVTGSRIREMKTDEEWDELLDKHEIVFARTSPQQKLQIVEHLQRREEVVAVTGDGVNDSPALKKAQIGVAMGLGGSDVAREAADIVLLDDEFPSIVQAIEEGRVVYDNLKKTIAYSLTHAIPEVFPIFLNIVLWMPLGLGGLLILSIDLVTEQGPAISLAYEPAESNVMERPPRDPAVDRLVSAVLLRYAYLIAGIMEAWICMVAFFSIFLWYGVPISGIFNNVNTYWNPSAPTFVYPCYGGPNAHSKCQCSTVNGEEICQLSLDTQTQMGIYYEAQSAWYITLVLCQFWHIWTCKTRQVSLLQHNPFKNAITIYGTLFSITVMTLIVYIPALHEVFQTGEMPGIGWLPNLIFAMWVFPYTEYSKYLTRKNPDGWWAHNMQW